MDIVAALLDGPRARGAFVLRSAMAPPWALRIQDDAPLTVVAIHRGTAYYVADDAEPVGLGAGDVMLIRGPGHYTVADDPETPPQVVIHPEQRCTAPDGGSLDEEMRFGLRSWSNAGDDHTVMLTGIYPTAGDVGGRLLKALPDAVVLRHGEWESPAPALLASEIERDLPGQEAVLDRILDLLLISAVRAWLDRPEANPPGWYRAASDPVVGPALRLLHDDPAHPWTLDELARRSGISRAGLARRFHDLVGEPPMTYLAGWRIALAADLLLEPGANVASVAEQVGYSTPFALSAAFKRVRGISPRDHRARALREPGAAAVAR